MSGSTRERRSGLAARLYSRVLLQIGRMRRALLEPGRPPRMVLLEALELGNRRKLFLVACDEHRFLVGAGSDRIGTLVALPEASPKAAADASLGGTAVQSERVARSSAPGRQVAWMARSVFRRGAGSGLELVRRDSLACSAAGSKDFEAVETQ